MYHSFFIHLPVNGYLGCFHVLAIVNSAVMTIGVHVSLSILFSSVYMPRSGIAGVYDSSISSFFCLFVYSFLTLNIFMMNLLFPFWSQPLSTHVQVKGKEAQDTC